MSCHSAYRRIAMRILILEHDINLGERLFAALRNEGWSLDWTTDAETAKQSLIRFDVSLMILGMAPELSRLARTNLLRDIRKIRRTTPMLLIVDGEFDVEELHESADLILVQPVDIEQIKRRIKILLTQGTSNADSKAIRNEGQMSVNHFA